MEHKGSVVVAKIIQIVLCKTEKEWDAVEQEVDGIQCMGTYSWVTVFSALHIREFSPRLWSYSRFSNYFHRTFSDKQRAYLLAFWCSSLLPSEQLPFPALFFKKPEIKVEFFRKAFVKCPKITCWRRPWLRLLLNLLNLHCSVHSQERWYSSNIFHWHS